MPTGFLWAQYRLADDETRFWAAIQPIGRYHGSPTRRFPGRGIEEYHHL